MVAGVEGLRADFKEALELVPRPSNCRDAVELNTAHDSLQLLTADEVAGLLRVDPRTLREMRNAGEFPKPMKVGRSLRWRRRTVERFLAESER
jgi:excisionase family DNA binding protein